MRFIKPQNGVRKIVESNSRFKTSMAKAYKSKRNYNISRINGRTVMTLSGVKNKRDLLRSGLDTYGTFARSDYGKKHIPPNPFNAGLKAGSSVSNLVSLYTGYKLSKVAKKNHVDMVIGHSRGARKAGYMKKFTKGIDYGAVDGAMIINPDKNMYNYASRSLLDRSLAATGKNNYYSKKSRFFSLKKDNLHWAYKL